MPINWLTIRKFSEETGYSENAINSKIDSGIWIEGKVWAKAPDGRRLISTEGFNQWVEKASAKPRKAASKSTSGIRVGGARKGSSSSPQPLT